MALESKFQKEFIDDLKELFPGCMVLKNDSSYIQGIPDLTLFYQDKWATFECKRSKTAPSRPNQEYYVKKMNAMSFSRKVYPENKQEVLNDLQRAFATSRRTRLS